MKCAASYQINPEPPVLIDGIKAKVAFKHGLNIHEKRYPLDSDSADYFHHTNCFGESQCQI